MNYQPFETLEEVRAYLSGNKIQCLVCGRHYRRLQYLHLAMHGMTADDYREAFGIPWKTSLTSAPSREASSRAMTPDRIEALRLVSAKLSRRDRNTDQRRPLANAVRNKWKQSAVLGRYLARQVVTTNCVTCGVPFETTALCATQPIHCEACATPGSLKARRYYRRQQQKAA
jgi:hypothetical protein